jgi:N-carbamoyl-L-amino-acid hydrolase
MPMRLSPSVLLLLLAFLPFQAAPEQASPAVNGARLSAHLADLSKFGANPKGGVSRVAYTPADLEGRVYVTGLMQDAGLETHVDLAGNIVGARPGSDASLRPLILGSHIDSVPAGGNYDGDVGSLAAIEIAQSLKERRIALRHPLEVIVFQNEEGGTVGSRALGEGLTPAQLGAVAQSGKTIGEGIRLLGGNPGRISEARRRTGDIAGYFELHIEQGGRLEREKTDIGVVEGIVGILHSEVTIDGFANHAGATPMDQRHDAMLSAGRFIEKVNQVVTGMPGSQVGTVGWIRAEPGAYNVIPGRVTLGLEVRDLDEQKFTAIFRQLQKEADSIGAMNQTRFTFSEPSIVHPSLTDVRMRKVIDDAARSMGLSTKSMPSGAGHDAQEIARIAPAGMIFIPSVRGISHSPEEFSRPGDIENGANVLLRAALAFDKQ